MNNMAKKDPSEYTVEEKLKTLYELQTILSEIDKIKILRGELPLEVKDLEDEIVGLGTRIENINNDIKSIRENTVAFREEMEQAKRNIEKYTQDQNNVRNNREFDLLNKEIEYNKLVIEHDEKKINDAKKQEQQKSEELERSTAALDERSKDLEMKKSELEDIVAETKAEEEKLREQARDLELNIEPRLLTSFKRIRKSSRNGLGIVYVDRDACAGCFSKIPPQRQMDIRMRKKIIVCENCGRIMIDPELAGVQQEKPAEAPAPKRRGIRRATKAE
ncbi:MAG: C4-type zinc ribbon domain-containing protein [Bacteroidales bacterium]|nr:C4-type zinc ribbon domain-containing protein [Bacteroidales bacterium]